MTKIFWTIYKSFRDVIEWKLYNQRKLQIKYFEFVATKNIFNVFPTAYKKKICKIEKKTW